MAALNPLRHRYLRNLKKEAGTYLVIFFLMLLSISFVSGFLVADNSMIIAYNESFEKYHVEDGNFRVRTQLNGSQQKLIRRLGVTLTPNYYVEEPVDNGSTIRIFQNRETVNLACVMEGRLPENSSEIAIDRMYADNNDLHTGDQISANGHTWSITGLVALPDYSCLFQNNNDSMFDSVMFGVAVVDEDGFEQIKSDGITYSYSWNYDHVPEDTNEEHDVSEAFLKELRQIVTLEDYIPRYQNQAITFTGEDMGSDKSMMEILLYIIIVIIGFVFGVTINDTIRKESNVIGTLRALGYTRNELIRHYMTMPLIITLIAALVGNILGYTVMKYVAADMYYGSYSLPTYVTIWNAEAFLKTTCIPIVIMITVTGLILHRQLKLSPLRFLRRDLSRRKRKRAFYLPHRLPIIQRYRTRVILQNLGSYLVLFIGIMFANLLLMFGMQLPKLMDNFQTSITDNMIADYQYLLKIPLSLSDDSAMKLNQTIDYMEYRSAVETENPDAEKFTAASLRTEDIPGIHYDFVTLYGIIDHSKYVSLNFQEGEVFISDAYAEKYSLKPGDEITLKEEYRDKTYTFKIGGIAYYPGSVAVFMPMKDLNRRLGYSDDTFAGYFSKTPITDIDESYISTVIDEDAMTKVSRQLNVSMGSLMYLVDAFAIVMYVILIYLLSRMIIEKNAQSISMTRILGFTNHEVSRLYITATTIVVLISMVISIPLLAKIMIPLFTVMLRSMMSGWLPIHLDTITNFKMLGIGALTYSLVAVLEFRKIQSISLEEALKHVE